MSSQFTPTEPPLLVQESTINPALIANVRENIATTVTPVVLSGLCRNLILSSDTGAAEFYFTIDGTNPSANNYAVKAAETLTLKGLPEFTTVKILGAAATGKFSLLAW